ncbi:JAB domain-containing protein [Arthrospiribacter ruber]|uniref:JAB domain-containing protein n=1 Tax=Arthrospiribacter ruber TaxID=2487934 RepID=UPI001FE363E5|nr:JAB domain-containing protein [Arthrospiribacter ruber]
MKPSEQDRRLTKKRSEAGKHLDIIVLDHIIFTEVLNELCRRRQDVMERGGRLSFFGLNYRKWNY